MWCFMVSPNPNKSPKCLFREGASTFIVYIYIFHFLKK